MRQAERDELMIRMDERIKTVFNNMDNMEDLFTGNRIKVHHEMVDGSNADNVCGCDGLCEDYVIWE